ncbi:MAG: ATP-binding cassette domain-containing protein [Burkholderiaceae bacterium]
MSKPLSPETTAASGIVATGLSKTFTIGDESIQVLRSVDFSLQPGERVAILGASGSGKSTLLHLLGGLDTPTTGEVTIDGRRVDNLSESERGTLRNRYLGFVYQFHHLLGEFTASENVAMPLRIRGLTSAQAAVDADQMLNRVGLSHRLNHVPAQLSGGERQRVALARAMVTAPRYVMADEPTGNLDRQTAMQVFELMASLSRESGTGFVVVTHDIELAARMDRRLTIRDGQIEVV